MLYSFCELNNFDEVANMAIRKGTVKGKFGGEICECDVEGNFVYDSNYGADADGNRGISAEFIEDCFVTEAFIELEDGVRNLTDKECDLVDFNLDDVEWEECDESDFEPDCDERDWYDD